MNLRLSGYLLPVLVFGCDQATLHDSDTVRTHQETTQEGNHRAPNPASGSLLVGTHQIGEDTLDDFIPLADGGSLPIVYGPQGSYMVILSIQLPHWTEPKVNISISTHFEDEVVASLFYSDISVEKTPEGAYVSNLFMLTNNWEEYAERPLLVEIHCSGKQTKGHTDLVLHFATPQKSFF